MVIAVMAISVTACTGSDASAPHTPSSPATVQGRPEPDAPPPPKFGQPYRYGEPQAQVPPIVDGKAPVVRHIPTDKPYVFITMDDGAVKDPQALQLIKESGARPTLFLNEKYFKGSEDFFRALQDQAGAQIGNHTISHPNLRGKPYDFQRREICGDSDAIAAAFGHRPVLFRPPFGNQDVNTQKAVADCGMKAIVQWSAAVNDGVVQFQAGDHLKPGDIVLMHFRHTFVADYRAFLERAKRDGLTPVPLPDFLS
jgi:peptidoglycan/xylan/chitin deacetylase (PgdA/CDA1 family)